MPLYTANAKTKDINTASRDDARIFLIIDYDVMSVLLFNLLPQRVHDSVSNKAWQLKVSVDDGCVCETTTVYRDVWCVCAV